MFIYRGVVQGSTAFLAAVALLFTIATLQSENNKLRNVVRNQANQIDESMYANDSAYKTLDDVNK